MVENPNEMAVVVGQRFSAQYCLQVTEQQRLKAELQHQVDKLQTKIDQQRIEMGGINNAAEQTNKVNKAFVIM